MKKYTEMTPQERQAEYAAVKAKFEQLKGMGLSLNMARGKPGKAQLDLAGGQPHGQRLGNPGSGGLRGQAPVPADPQHQ